MLTANCSVPMVLMIYHSDLFYFWSVDTCFHVSYHNVYTSLQVADGVVCVNYLACSYNIKIRPIAGIFRQVYLNLFSYMCSFNHSTSANVKKLCILMQNCDF